MKVRGPIWGSILVILLVCSNPTAALPQPQVPQGPVIPPAENLDRAVGFLLDHADADGCISGSARNTAWAVIALIAAGADPQRPTATGSSLVDGLRTCEPDRLLFGEPLTSLQRHLLAIVAAGEDPDTFNGRDWEQEIRDAATADGFFDPYHPNGLNDDMFGILALAAAGAPPDDPDIQNAADRLLENQNPDGGWSHSTSIAGNGSDTDMTAAALQALRHAARLETHDVTRDALAFLEQRKQDTRTSDQPGCLSSRGDLSNPDVDSTSWAILGLLAVHEDPRSRPWGAHGTPWSCLLTLQDTRGGFPSAPGGSPAPWPTAYAILALTGSPFATVHPDMERPQSTIRNDTEPRPGIPVRLEAPHAAWAGWWHEDGAHTPGVTIEWVPQQNGPANFTVLLLDPHGLTSLALHTVLVATPDPEPAPSEDPTPEPPPGGNALRLEAAATALTGNPVTVTIDTDPGNADLRYRVDWGDGNTTNWSHAPRFSHTYTQPGTHTIHAWGRSPAEVLVGPALATITVEDPVQAAEAQRSDASQIPAPYLSFLLVTLLAALLTARRPDRCRREP